MRDEKVVDDKIICVPLEDPNWNGLEDLDDLPALLREEITQFFSIHKDLEVREVVVDGWRPKGGRARGNRGLPRALHAFRGTGPNADP